MTDEEVDPLALFIHRYIERLPAERRLYPDLYAEDFAAKIRARIAQEEPMT